MPPTARDSDRPSVSKPSPSGTNLSSQKMTIWQRGKARVSRLLDNTPPKTRTTHEPTSYLPYEIMEMIIAHLTHDLDTLKACSLTCRSWYLVTVPRIHHTLILKGEKLERPRDRLKILSKMQERGLMPFVKEIRVSACYSWYPLSPPGAFSRNYLRYFSAFTNVQTLRLDHMDISSFASSIERHFRHFSPTLRSIALCNPRCTSRQLSHFLSLFSNLDDIYIRKVYTYESEPSIPDTALVPVSPPKLRGRLTLHFFFWTETWKDLINSCGGLHFRHLDLFRVADCAPVLLKACARTVETIRFHVPYIPEHAIGYPSPGLDLSGLKVLRSLQVEHWTTSVEPATTRRHDIVMGTFSTIASPVFSELVVVLWEYGITSLPSDIALFEALRIMNETKPFKLVFLVEVVGLYQEEERRELKEALDSVMGKGLLDFLDSSPDILINPRTPWP